MLDTSVFISSYSLIRIEKSVTLWLVMTKFLIWLVVIGFIGGANALYFRVWGCFASLYFAFRFYNKAVLSITKFFGLYSPFAKNEKIFFGT